MKKKLSLFGIIVLVVAVAIFSILNIQKVDVNFFSLKIEMPLVLLIICSVLIGVVLTMLFSSVTSFKHKRKIRQLNNQVADLKKKIDNQD